MNIPNFFKAYLENLHPSHKETLHSYLNDCDVKEITEILMVSVKPNLYLRFYEHFGKNYWLCSVSRNSIHRPDNGQIYFQMGKNILAGSCPTWFPTKQSGIDAAKEQGYYVVVDET